MRPMTKVFKKMVDVAKARAIENIRSRGWILFFGHYVPVESMYFRGVESVATTVEKRVEHMLEAYRLLETGASICSDGAVCHHLRVRGSRKSIDDFKRLFVTKSTICPKLTTDYIQGWKDNAEEFFNAKGLEKTPLPLNYASLVASVYLDAATPESLWEVGCSKALLEVAPELVFFADFSGVYGGDYPAGIWDEWQDIAGTLISQQYGIVKRLLQGNTFSSTPATSLIGRNALLMDSKESISLLKNRSLLYFGKEVSAMVWGMPSPPIDMVIEREGSRVLQVRWYSKIAKGVSNTTTFSTYIQRMRANWKSDISLDYITSCYPETEDVVTDRIINWETDEERERALHREGTSPYRPTESDWARKVPTRSDTLARTSSIGEWFRRSQNMVAV